MATPPDTVVHVPYSQVDGLLIIHAWKKSRLLEKEIHMGALDMLQKGGVAMTLLSRILEALRQQLLDWTSVYPLHLPVLAHGGLRLSPLLLIQALTRRTVFSRPQTLTQLH